jgi:hypothetical protein
LTSAKYLRIGLDEGPPPDRQGRRELLAYHEKYQSEFHTYVFHKDPNDSDARQRVTARLRFLARKLVRDLCMARKIFVYRDPLPAAASNGAALCATLRRYGPNTLLWVSPAQPSHPPGLVEWVGDGLMQGYIDRLRKGHDDPISYELWLRICRNARNLWVGGAPAVLTAVPVPKVHRSCALN